MPNQSKLIALKNYNIHLGDFTQPFQNYLGSQSYSSIHILVDENTKQHCLPIVLANIPILVNANIIEIQSGEIHKTLDTCMHIWNSLLQAGTDRKALLINLGGGVIGDMGGFCAVSYKRGIDFVQIPTTLLAQVDASVGGKLGIDFKHVKNIIGFFQNPKAVFIDPQFLKTLPKRQVRNGFAEIVKHALIADANYWEQLQNITAQNIHQIDWTSIIYHSLQIKKQVVVSDPYEQGLRKILNFGHTIGHAIESYSLAHDTEPLLHGEAIAIGMRAELYLSEQLSHLATNEQQAASKYLQAHYNAYPIQPKQLPEILAYLKNDKKNEAGQLNFSLLNTIGEANYNTPVTHLQIKQAIMAVCGS